MRQGKGVRLLDVRELTTQETFLSPLAFGAGAAQVPAHIAAIKRETLNFIVVGRTAETRMRYRCGCRVVIEWYYQECFRMLNKKGVGSLLTSSLRPTPVCRSAPSGYGI